MTQQQFSDKDLEEFRKKAPKYIKPAVIIIILAVIGFNSIFQVNPEEVGIITRLGKYVRTVDPGLNLKIPFFEKVQKVAVERQQKQEFGFRTTKADVRTEYTRGGAEGESLMLTGDLNLADVEWVVQYRIAEPYKYLFKVRNAESTLRDISEAAMRQIVGDRTVNEVLTVGRAEVAAKVKILVQDLSDEYDLGLRVEQVVLQDVNPPQPVRDAFNAVNQAQQEKETLINRAKSEYNKVIPRARGQAQETIEQAEGYSIARVNNAEGDVARFNQLYTEYAKAPGVTKRRLYLETLSEVLPKLGNKVIIDESGQNVFPLLQMQLKGSKLDTLNN